MEEWASHFISSYESHCVPWEETIMSMPFRRMALGCSVSLDQQQQQPLHLPPGSAPRNGDSCIVSKSGLIPFTWILYFDGILPRHLQEKIKSCYSIWKLAFFNQTILNVVVYHCSLNTTVLIPWLNSTESNLPPNHPMWTSNPGMQELCNVFPIPETTGTITNSNISFYIINYFFSPFMFLILFLKLTYLK